MINNTVFMDSVVAIVTIKHLTCRNTKIPIIIFSKPTTNLKNTKREINKKIYENAVIKK